MKLLSTHDFMHSAYERLNQSSFSVVKEDLAVRFFGHLQWSDRQVDSILTRKYAPSETDHIANLQHVSKRILPVIYNIIDSHLRGRGRGEYYAREFKNLLQWGPRSNVGGLDEDGRSQDFIRVADSNHGLLLNDEFIDRFNVHVKEVISFISESGYARPVTLRQAWFATPFNTSYGWPLFGRKSKWLNELGIMSRKLNRLATTQPEKYDPFMSPFVASKRSKAGKLPTNSLTFKEAWQELLNGRSEQYYWDKTGARFVHMSPAPEVVVLGRVGEPLKRLLSMTGVFESKLGPMYLDRAIQHRMHTPGTWFSMDAESFDLTVPSILSRTAFEIIDSLGRGEEWSGIVYVAREQMMSAPMVLTEQYTWIRRNDGVIASGHRLTNDVDSIITLLLISIAIWELYGLTISEAFNDKDFFVQINGDDALVHIPYSYHEEPLEFVSKLSEVYRRFGMNLNVTKQLVSDLVAEMNNRMWFKYGGFGPLPSAIGMLERMFYPESIPLEDDDSPATVDTDYITAEFVQLLSEFSRYPEVHKVFREVLTLDREWKIKSARQYIRTANRLHDRVLAGLFSPGYKPTETLYSEALQIISEFKG